VPEQFVEFYYRTFDTTREQLKDLYQPMSMLTFEGSPVQGTEAIVKKLLDLPFQKIEHQVATLDAQPSGDHGGIFVVVSGALLVEEEKRPMSYTQTFQLMPNGQGSYFIFNDVFRLVYPAA
ncbi:nuclear transport factor 2, partial [Polychaeton citri CBS 116435]